MKCGNFFWKIRKLQFSSVLQSPGKVGRSGRKGNPRIKIPTWNKFASVLEKKRHG